MKRVLVLGAGMVSRPLVRHLLEKQGHQVTLGDRNLMQVQSVIGSHPNGTAVQVEATDIEALKRLVRKANIAVSILPPTSKDGTVNFHANVAGACVAEGVPLVTSSYADNTAGSAEAAQSSKVIILNEMGLDPGIDHFSAMRIIRDARARGEEIISFTSFCGGLPAPETANTLGYKFSWSPAGVFKAMLNDAIFLRDGERTTIRNAQLFANPSQHPIDGIEALEGYPNRNSLQYLSAYGLEGIRDMQRGTLRMQNWCAFWDRVAKLGVISNVPMDLSGLSYANLTRRLMQTSGGNGIEAEFARHLKIREDAKIIVQARELGLFEDELIPATDSDGDSIQTPLAALALIAQKRMKYAPGERDMSVMQHVFLTRNGSRRRRITSTLLEFGDPNGDSSMSRLVGLTAAIGVKLIAEGKIEGRGSLIPTTPDIYEPALAELAALGIRMQEKVEEV